MKINVKVKPNSNEEKIEKISEEYYLVFLKKPATEGKANLELIKVLSKYFKKDVRIVSGKSSKKKIVDII